MFGVNCIIGCKMEKEQINYRVEIFNYSKEELLFYQKQKLEDYLLKKSRVKTVFNMMNKDFTSLLDIGAYLGKFLHLVRQFNPKVTKLYALECSKECVDICKELYEDDVLKFFHHDCGNFPFTSKEFDVVTFFEVLEHVRNVDVFLKEVNRVLKSDGYVYLSVPNATWWRNIIKDIVLNKDKYRKKMEHWPSYTVDQRDHVNNYNFIHLYRILNLNGFELVELDYYDLTNLFLFDFRYFKNLSTTMVMRLKKVGDV